jgi:ParB-like chromosome segregation protein Spo0J
MAPSRKGKSAPAAAKFPAYDVEKWPAGKLKPYAGNARLHSPEQIAQLRGSFRQFGQVWPVLVRKDGTLIAGHGRLEAAKAEGFKTVRVIVANGWTEEQCRAFALLDNRVPLNAEWDKERLAAELSALQGAGTDLSALGFEPAELASLLAPGSPGLTDPDDAPEPPANPVSRVGDDRDRQHVESPRGRGIVR